MDTIKDYWRTWLWRDAVTKLITINFIVWLSAAVCDVFFNFDIAQIFALPSYPQFSPIGYLSVLTYMFLQTDFLHMFFNMMWLLLFGQLFMQAQSGLRLVIIYIYGGIAGAISFLLFHLHPYMLGASCSVLAIVGASSMMLPKWRVNLILLGSIEVIWIALAAVVIFIIMSSGPDQASAHTAGLAVGILFTILRKKGIDITSPVKKIIDAVKGARTLKASPTHKSKYRTEAEEFDALLEKISHSGYQSLTSSERQRLFNLSQKIKK